MSNLLSDSISDMTNWVTERKEKIIMDLIGKDCTRYPMRLLEMKGVGSRESYLIPIDTKMLYIEFINDFSWDMNGDKYEHGISIKYEWTYI